MASCKKDSNVPADGVLLKEKALNFAKQLDQLDSKALHCWQRNWKKGWFSYIYSLIFCLQIS